jgi:hypothetical protein
MGTMTTLDGAQLYDDSPAAAVSSAILQSSFSWLHPFTHRLRGRVPRGTATPDTAHIDEGGLGIESNNQQFVESFE